MSYICTISRNKHICTIGKKKITVNRQSRHVLMKDRNGDSFSGQEKVKDK